MQTQINVRQEKTIWSKLRQYSGLLLFSLILTACGQDSDSQQDVISDNKLSTSLPKTITPFLVDNTGSLIVDVVIDGKTDDPSRVESLLVDTAAGTFSGNVSKFPTGTYLLSLVYSINVPALGRIVEVITTSGITVTVVANEDTPADFSSAEITYTDSDEDSFSNLDELKAGTDPDTPNYTVGGEVEGLTGSGLILQNNGSDNLIISENGTFSFSPTAIDDDEYVVTVQTQPGSPEQTCTVNNGSGTIDIASISDISVICTVRNVTDMLEVTASTASIKTIRFEWSAYVGATHYKLLVNPDSVSGFNLLQDSLPDTSTTITMPVHLTDWINVRYILEAHDASGKLMQSSPVSITPLMLSNIGYVTASNAGTSDWFGVILSLSGDGNTLAVGAQGEDSNATGINPGVSDETNNMAENSGAVYVFIRNTTDGTWQQQAYIKGSNTEAGDEFGSAVSLSNDGNTLAVGADEEDSNATGINPGVGDEADNTATDSGAVYVFIRKGNSWSQQAYVKASNTEKDDQSNTEQGDQFGRGLSLSGDGNTLAVGAYLEDSSATGVSTDSSGEANNMAKNSGAVYVFNRNGDSWSQQAYVKASNTGEGDQFGFDVSLSNDGNMLAVGAFQEDSSAIGVNSDEADNTAVDSGAVYVFSRNVNSWSQQAYVKASNTGEGDMFGFAVSLSGNNNTLAVGAFQEDSNATGINPEADNTATNSGAVYVFSRNTTDGIWSQQAYVKASNTGGGDEFGRGLNLSHNGNILAVEAPSEDGAATGVSTDGSGENDNGASNSGAAYVFSRDIADIWRQRTYVKAKNTKADDRFGPGRGMSLSNDGNILAVGGGGPATEAVYLY